MLNNENILVRFRYCTHFKSYRRFTADHLQQEGQDVHIIRKIQTTLFCNLGHTKLTLNTAKWQGVVHEQSPN